MKKVLLTCGAGASSGFMAQKMRQAAKKKNLEYQIKAVSESEVNEYMKDYDILLIGPHLKYKLDSLQKEAKNYGISVQLIDEKIYGELDGERLLDQVDIMLSGPNKTVAKPEKETVKESEIPDTVEMNDGKKDRKAMTWIQDTLVPKMNKIIENGFIKAIQDSMMLVLPFIMVGSLITILNIIREKIPAFPDLTLVNSFSFGLFSLFLAFLVPYKVMENYGVVRFKFYAALSGVASYLLLTLPVIDTNMSFVIEKLGAGGMLVALFTSIVVSAVFLLFSKFSFFKKDTTMPDIVVSWTDSLIPVFVILLGATIIFNAKIDIYKFISDLFNPLFSISQSLAGIIIISLAVTVLYAFGISNWVIFPVVWAIWMQGIADNAALIQAGRAATNLNLMEFFHGFIYIGGTGATLVLVVMMLFSKSKRLKLMGRLTIVPSIFNINEPVVFGTPIAFNPFLMIPMIMLSVILPLITYFAFKIGFVAIPSEPFQVWYLPVGIYSFLATKDLRSFLLIAVNIAVSAAVYYPFFKAYEKQEVKKEIIGEQ